LHPTTRQLLAIAAVQGHEFDSATIALVSGVAPPAREVEERLRGAEATHGLVTFVREQRLAGRHIIADLSLRARFSTRMRCTAPSRRPGVLTGRDAWLKHC